MIKKVLLIFLLIFLQSCIQAPNQGGKLYLPNGKIFAHMPQTDNEVYKHAWRQGCESGLSTGFSKEFVKGFYSFVKDIRFVGFKYGDQRDLFMGKEITSDDKTIYNRVWFDTFKACRDYSVGSYKAPSFANWSPRVAGQAAGWWDDPTLVYEISSWNNGGQNIAFW